MFSIQSIRPLIPRDLNNFRLVNYTSFLSKDPIRTNVLIQSILNIKDKWLSLYPWSEMQILDVWDYCKFSSMVFPRSLTTHVCLVALNVVWGHSSWFMSFTMGRMWLCPCSPRALVSREELWEHRELEEDTRVKMKPPREVETSVHM